MHFLEWKRLNFKYNFNKRSAFRSNLQYVNIGLDNSFTSNSQQAIIWSNDDPILWHAHASPGLTDLNLQV